MGSARQHGDGPLILLAEACLETRRAACRALVAADYAVVALGEGLPLQALARQRPPALLVAATDLPDLDAPSLLAGLREDPATRELPTLLISPPLAPHERAEILRLGARDLVERPLCTEELVLRVQRALIATTPVDASMQRRPPHFLAGHTRHLPMADLLQILAINSQTGCLRVRSRQQGKVDFDRGRIVAAFTPRARGRKALFRILAWPEAEFFFDPDSHPPQREELEANTQRLLLDALVALDDLRRLMPRLPPRHAQLEPSPLARQMIEQPGRLTPLDFDLLAATRRGIAFGELLDSLEATDLEIGLAVVRLLERGALSVVGRSVGT